MPVSALPACPCTAALARCAPDCASSSTSPLICPQEPAEPAPACSEAAVCRRDVPCSAHGAVNPKAPCSLGPAPQEKAVGSRSQGWLPGAPGMEPQMLPCSWWSCQPGEGSSTGILGQAGGDPTLSHSTLTTDVSFLSILCKHLSLLIRLSLCKHKSLCRSGLMTRCY